MTTEKISYSDHLELAKAMAAAFGVSASQWLDLPAHRRGYWLFTAQHWFNELAASRTVMATEFGPTA